MLSFIENYMSAQNYLKSQIVAQLKHIITQILCEASQ